MAEARTIDDPQFVKRVRAGEPEALQMVVHTYLGQILRAAQAAGLGAPHAQDVTQKTFETFIEKARLFEGRSRVRTWLFGILYKKISAARRELKRAHTTDDIDRVMEQRFRLDGRWIRPPRALDVKLYHKEVREFLEDCMAIVPTQQRMAFLLREVEELETEEICKILSVTPTNLGVLFYRGRNRLRECLEAKGVKGTTP